ncbi:hypothetical protein HPG69_001647, partial [Diceros bicornis minor]
VISKMQHLPVTVLRTTRADFNLSPPGTTCSSQVSLYANLLGLEGKEYIPHFQFGEGLLDINAYNSSIVASNGESSSTKLSKGHHQKHQPERFSGGGSSLTQPGCQHSPHESWNSQCL